MNRRLVRIAPALLALTLLSCAAGNIVPERHSMPAARAALRPEFRLFYDALGDYGDWVLIEPWGYVFRPRTNFDTWRPFGQGMWVPTDLYGWVWVSSEPYGWATYHYGDWIYDPYQGYVWQPGLNWSPAQVVWQTTDNYVGWAPLMANPSLYNAVPGGAFNYVAVKDLAATDLSSRIVGQRHLDAQELERARPVQNEGQSGGVSFSRGPRIEWVERYSGMLKRARVDDVVPAVDPALQQPQTQSPGSPSDSLGLATKRAALKATTETRANRGALPSRVQVVRPYGSRERQSDTPRWGNTKLPAKVTKDRNAGSDSTATKP